MTSNVNKIHFDTILLDLKATDAKQVYKKLVKHVSNIIGTPEKFLLDMIIGNEEAYNSGVENGVAVIHARLPRLTRPMIVYSKTTDPIDFNAADGVLVDMITLVLSPDFESAQHLQRLAMVTRFFNNKKTRIALRNAEDFNGVRAVTKEMNLRKKAA